MANFFEDLGKKLGETAESVTAIASDAVELQKLKHQIRNLARGNSYDLEDLGRAVYQKFQEGSLEDETATELCGAIQEREEQIQVLNDKIAIIKGEQTCPVCGRTVSKEMTYCPYCGTKMPEFPQAEEEEAEDVGEAVEEAVEGENETETATEKEESKEQSSCDDKVEEAIDKAKVFASQAADYASDAADKASAKFHEFLDKVSDKAGDDATKADEENIVESTTSEENK